MRKFLVSRATFWSSIGVLTIVSAVAWQSFAQQQNGDSEQPVATVVLPIESRAVDQVVYVTERTRFICPIRDIYQTKNGAYNVRVFSTTPEVTKPVAVLVEDMPTKFGKAGGATIVVDVTPDMTSDRTIVVSYQQEWARSARMEEMVRDGLISPSIAHYSFNIKVVPGRTFEEYVATFGAIE